MNERIGGKTMVATRAGGKKRRHRVATVVVAAGLATIGLLGCGSSGPSRSADGRTSQFTPGLQTQLRGVITEVNQKLQVPGIVAAVNVPGQGSFTEATGHAVEPSTAATPQTKFRIGSITKTFTATAILQLVDQHKLNLSQPIATWVPTVQNASTITVRQLLNMTSGIYDEGGPGSELVTQAAANPAKVWTPQQIIALAVAHGPAGPPGAYEYSDTNYVILGVIAQAVSGEPIGTLITNRILQPLHLTNTSYPTGPAIPQPTSAGYLTTSTGKQPFPAADPSIFGAAGNMISTVADLQTWAKALATGKLLSPALQAQRLRTGGTAGEFQPLKRVPNNKPLTASYGLGLFKLGGLIGHNGEALGYTSEMLYLPARDATIIVLTNAQTTQLQGETPADLVAVSLAELALPNDLHTTA